MVGLGPWPLWAVLGSFLLFGAYPASSFVGWDASSAWGGWVGGLEGGCAIIVSLTGSMAWYWASGVRFAEEGD